MDRYTRLITSGATILTDGATGTRVRLETTTSLDPHLDVAGLAIDGRGSVLRAVAGEYAAIAAATGLPIELDTMTYWASPDHVAAAGREAEFSAINQACVDAVAPLRQTGDVVVAGVIGPRGDGYRAGDSMEVDESATYHARQAEVLADSEADVLFGLTMSSVDEATGVAIAASRTGRAYALGFVVDATGRLPDGTSLHDVVARIDALGDARPVHYLVNCTHPAVALAAMRHLRLAGHDVSDRVIGIKANGAQASPDVLESTDRVLSDPPLGWLEPMLELRREFGFRVLGGCCGTDGRHLLALALALTEA